MLPGRFVLVFLFLAVPAAAQTEEELETARRFFEEARELSEADGGALWGAELYGPMLFVDPVARLVFANEDAQPEGELVEWNGVFVGEQPQTIFPANAAQSWGGKRWATIVWQSVPRVTYRRRALFAHELFHRIQSGLGFPPRTPPNAHLETELGRTWLRLELRALAEALLRDGEQREEAVADALLFRARRHELFEGTAESERQPELHEGLAQYTGLRLSTLPQHALATWAARRVAEEESTEGTDPIWMMRRISGEESTASLAPTFAYQTGAAYGLLLDDHAPDWRASLDASADLSELLRAALELELPEDVARAAGKRTDAYQGWLIEEDEARRRVAREKKQAAYHARLVESPVLILPLGSGRRQFSYQTSDITLLSDVGRVYEKVEVAASWGSLTVRSGGALSHVESNGTPRDVILPAPADPEARPLEGDDWTLELGEGWRIEPGEREGDWIARRE